MPIPPEPRPIVRLVCGLVAVLATVLPAIGCPSGTTEHGPEASPDAPPPTLRLMIVGDSGLAEAIERELRASGRGEVQIELASSTEIASVRRLPADGIIYPSGMIGELAQRRLIAPLPDWTADDPHLNRADLFPLIRSSETTWGYEVFAVPFGSPQLAVLFRNDLLQRLGQSPPTNWRQFDDLAAMIAQSGDLADLPRTGDPLWHALAQPLAEGWAGQIFLARAAAYVRHPDHISALFDYQSMDPLVDRPPYVRALEELVRTASPQSLEATPATVRGQLLAGQCALALTWPTRTMDWPEGDKALGLELGCVEMPGSREIYDFQASQWQQREQLRRVPLLGASGYLGSVSSSARHTRSVAEALVWLASAEKGQDVAIHSPHCTLYRSSQVQSAPSWVHRDFGPDVPTQYADALQAAHGRPQWLHSPRIPGREKYLKVLDDAVRTAVAGEKTPRLALADAADQWRQITAQYGVEKQRNAHMRSLGLQP